MDQAATYCQENFPKFLEQLKTLVRIPSVSFDGFPKEEVKRSAKAVADLLKESGLQNIEILEIPGAHPYVYADHLHAPGKPTVLLYAHHDVQPPGREELWKTAPFEPTEKPGPGGMRLFARGAADDKAGVIVHTATISSFLKTMGSLPLNVKIVIEGEEETGSEHLESFLMKYREKLQADVLILTDTMNYDCGIPALTVALRGMVGLDIEVRALTKAIHSGMWGGPIPDPAMALSKMLASLVDEKGQITIPGVMEQWTPLSEEEEKQMLDLPYDEASFREASGMIPNAHILQKGPSPIGQLWRYPSLTVNALQASSRKQAGNIINDAAWSKVTIRLAKGMDAKKTLTLLQNHLKRQAPWGLDVTFKVEACTDPWDVEPKGMAFEAAERAMQKGYGKKPYFIGCGGSIPFVKPFAAALGGAPALLVGVEDPYTNAHGENESLLIDDLKKACLSEIHLFSELAEKWTKKA